MGSIAILSAALAAAVVTSGILLRELRKTIRVTEKCTRRWASARKTLAATKQENEELTAEAVSLKNVLYDVAKGEAHVWIGDDGELRAARGATGNTPIH